MFSPELVAEADRQFAVCNACRYCEGFCAVFSAAELRTALAARDVAYLANLCHDCRMCYDACAFTPPHPYAVNVPQVLADGRLQSYAAYARPSPLAALFANPAPAAFVAIVVGMSVAFGTVLARGGASLLGGAQLGPGAFYRVVPYLAMLVPALALVLGGIVATVASARAFARDLRGDGAPFVNGATIVRALRDAFLLVYLRGGGGGCYERERGSQRRRIFHLTLVGGVLADLAATTAAFVAQDIDGRLPPYPLLSVPVLLGTLGGIAILVGCTGLAVVKRTSDERPASPRAVALDDAFLALLAVVAASGLALLAFRATPAMPSLLCIHLGALLGAFVTAPYGKLVHGVYRTISLIKSASEQSSTLH